LLGGAINPCSPMNLDVCEILHRRLETALLRFSPDFVEVFLAI